MTIPADPHTRLVQSTESSLEVDMKLYQSAVRSLLYLAIGTCPDIAYAVNKAAQHCSKASITHWNYVKRIMRYVLGTKELGLCYKVAGDTELVGYSDADFAGDSETSLRVHFREVQGSHYLEK